MLKYLICVNILNNLVLTYLTLVGHYNKVLSIILQVGHIESVIWYSLISYLIEINLQMANKNIFLYEKAISSNNL